MAVGGGAEEWTVERAAPGVAYADAGGAYLESMAAVEEEEEEEMGAPTIAAGVDL